MEKTDWKKYFIVFAITLVIFGSALYISNALNQKKVDQLKTIQDNLSVDILSSEVQFSLLEDLSSRFLPLLHNVCRVHVEWRINAGACKVNDKRRDDQLHLDNQQIRIVTEELGDRKATNIGDAALCDSLVN